MTVASAQDVLWERRVAFARRRRHLCQSEGPALSAGLSWPQFWDQVNAILRDCGYARSTRRQFRCVLRALRRAGVRRPAEFTEARAHRFIVNLAESHVSWSWIALHITALRDVFDRICGASVTSRLVTPKRGLRLPEILAEREAERVVQAGGTLRDQLLLGLLYGCGLSGSEAVNLRWRDVLDTGNRLRVTRSTRYLERIQRVPDPLRPLLQTGAEACDPGDYIFRGRTEGTHLSTRMVELLVRAACRRADVQRPVCVMTLRHSYAVHRLEAGVSLRRVQEALGHASIRTTERYLRCIPPRLDPHPFTEVRKRMAQYAGPDPDTRVPATDNLPAPPYSCTPTPATSPAPSARGPLSGLTSIDLTNLRLPFDRPEPTHAARWFRDLLKSRLVASLFRRSADRSP